VILCFLCYTRLKTPYYKGRSSTYNQCWVLDRYLEFDKVLVKFWSSFGHIKAVQNLSKTCPKLRILDKLPTLPIMEKMKKILYSLSDSEMDMNSSKRFMNIICYKPYKRVAVARNRHQF
jgi:hypothetical protein